MKKIAWILVLVLVVSMSPQYTFGEEKGESYTITIKDAERVASQMFQVLKQNEDSYDNANCKIGKKIALFNSDNDITAFYIEIVKKGENCGYFIVDSTYGNIIEYSTDKNNFIIEAKEEVEDEYNIDGKDQKIYYLGGINYAIGGSDNSGNNEYIDISSSNVNQISQEEMEDISEANELCSGQSVPDKKGDDYITDPDIYEKQYDSCDTYDVKNYKLDYLVMKDLSDGGVCAPTAATNLMFYWYNRGNKYKKLLTKDWKTTFGYFYKYMEADNKNGTKDNMVATGYTKYLNSKGYNSTIKFHKGTNNGNDIAKTLFDNKSPCQLLLHSHYKYGNHSVLAVGYRKYSYKHWYGTNYQTYIRIVDGWTPKPNRFVWGGCKGNWNYVTVNIK